MGWAELPTAYISQDKEEDCFVIYSTDVKELKEKLKINEMRGPAIAIKPVSSNTDRFELDGRVRFFYTVLQIYYTTEGPGWENEKTYSEKKNLFLFSVLSLSLYESESYINPYSKLDLWQRRKTVYLNIQRNHKEYQIPLTTVLYEMLYLLSKVPDNT